MYKVEPLSGNFDVNPELNFYQIEPIYPHLVDSPSENVQPTTPKKKVDKQSSPTKTVNNNSSNLEAQQNSLIEALKSFHIRVDKFIQQYDGKSKSKTAEKQEQPKKTNEKQKPKSDEKKQQKAEAKKQHKADAKFEESQGVLTIPAQKSTTSVTYHGLNASFDSIGYDSKQLPAKFSVSLQCHKNDKKWIVGISKLAEARGVQFSESPSGDRTIKVEYNDSDNIQLISSTFSALIKGRVAVWKSIGQLLGLFDFTDATLNAPTSQWLRLADDLLEGRVSAENGNRQLCQRLSAHDFLAANNIPSLSDFILKSIVYDSDYLANNVELWVKRLP